MSDCPFCQICDHLLPADIIYENDRVLAFRDRHPQAPFHVLVIPRRHIAKLLDLKKEDNELVGELFQVACHLARKAGLADRGFRTIFNCNADAGQTVWHLHLHVMGGWNRH